MRVSGTIHWGASQAKSFCQTSNSTGQNSSRDLPTLPADGPLSGKQEMFFAQRLSIKCCFTLTTISWGLRRVFGSKRRLRKKKIIWSFRKIVGNNYKTVVHSHYSFFFPLDETSVRRKQGVFPRLSSHSSSSCSIPAKNNHMFSLIFNHTFLFSTSGQIPSLPQRNWVVVICIFKDDSGFDKHKLGICQIWGAIKNSICCTAIKKKDQWYIKVNNVPFELNQQKKKKMRLSLTQTLNSSYWKVKGQKECEHVVCTEPRGLRKMFSYHWNMIPKM